MIQASSSTAIPSEVELYCDGACLGNPGPGGWAYLLRTRSGGRVREKEGSGAEAESTNNRMELCAAIRGLEALKRSCRVHLYSDSQYVVKGIREWLPTWKRKGWKKADKQPVLNVDLWQALDGQLARHTVEAHWVNGHAGHPENERVDRAANEQAASVQQR